MGQDTTKKLRGGYVVFDPAKNKTKMPPENSAEIPMLESKQIDPQKATIVTIPLGVKKFKTKEEYNKYIESLRKEEERRIANMKAEIRKGLARRNGENR